jgi:hypothetical protein
MLRYLLKRILHPGKIHKIFVERLTEPLHLNFLSLFVAIFGRFRTKVAFDLIVRQQYAFPILFAADLAARYGIRTVTLLEFGVASGAGLLNMCQIASAATKATGVEFRVFGFDTGRGMPPAIDYRDLPEVFQEGDFPMDVDSLSKSLPSFAKLIIGDISETVPSFLANLTADAPIGFISVDVDYYSSAKQVLQILIGPPQSYLPIVATYLDDIGVPGSNPWTGELLAVREFNEANELRKIAPFTLLRSQRIFKNTQWIDRMFAAHIHDHPLRSPAVKRSSQYVLPNEFLRQDAFKDRSCVE